MKRTLIDYLMLLTALSVCAVLALAATTAAHGQTYTLSRDRCRLGDHQRDWAYIWSIDGGCSGPVTLRDRAGVQSTPLPLRAEHRAPAWNDDERNYRTGFVVPSGMANGNYGVLVGGRETGLSLKVERVPPRSSLLLRRSSPEKNATAIEAGANAGYVLNLEPGLWTFNRTINLPEGAWLVGPGAVLQWQWPEPWNGTLYHQRCMVWGDHSTFVGLTFDMTGGGFLTWNGTGSGTVFDQCEFREGTLGNWNHLNNVVMRCRFVRAGAGYVAGGTWLTCDWDGVCASGHAFATEQGHRLCLVNGRFRDTDRGIVLRTGWGPMRDAYLSQLSFTGQSWVDNGCELIITEGGPDALPFERVMVYRVRAYQTEGMINLWEGKLSRWKFIDVVLDGSHLMAPCYNGGLTDCLLERWEVRRGYVELGESAKRNQLVRVNVVLPLPSRFNQFSHDHQPYDPAKLYGIRAIRPAGYDPATDPDVNVLKGCKIVGATVGRDTAGVRVD